MHIIDNDQTWRNDALCAQTDPEAFFPDVGTDTTRARRVCNRCPVQGQCLNDAVMHNEQFGIWGGLTSRQRRQFKTILVLEVQGVSPAAMNAERDADPTVRHALLRHRNALSPSEMRVDQQDAS